MKVLCKIVHFYKGVELMGSKQTARSDRNTEVEATPLGVKCTSFKSKRTVLVPWSNVTGCELFYEAPAPKEEKEATTTEPAVPVIIEPPKTASPVDYPPPSHMPRKRGPKPKIVENPPSA